MNSMVTRDSLIPGVSDPTWTTGTFLKKLSIQLPYQKISVTEIVFQIGFIDRYIFECKQMQYDILHIIWICSLWTITDW